MSSLVAEATCHETGASSSTSYLLLRTCSSCSEPLRLPVKEEELALPKSWPPRSGEDVDWEVPTHIAYQVQLPSDEDDDDKNKNNNDSHSFTSKFAAARAKLDYSYHKNPAWPRQVFQDAVLTRVLEALSRGDSNEQHEEEPARRDDPTLPRRPWIVFTAGPMGVGKSYVLSQLYQRDLFPLDQFCKVDPDLFKQEIPEMAGYQEYLKTQDNHDNDSSTLTAATQVHRESTQLSDVLFEHALLQELPILVDGSLRDVRWYRQLIQRQRTDFPKYKLMIVYVSASDHVIRRRATMRAEKTGREVPSDLLQATMDQVPKSVQALQGLTDITVEITNNDGDPMMLYLRHATQGLTSPSSSSLDEKDGSVEMDWDWLGDLWYDNDQTNETKDTHGDLSTREPHPKTTKRRSSPCPRRSILCHMASVFDDSFLHATARSIWSRAYPSMCPRCLLFSDSQCGICIHDRHMCACDVCKAGKLARKLNESGD